MFDLRIAGPDIKYSRIDPNYEYDTSIQHSLIYAPFAILVHNLQRTMLVCDTIVLYEAHVVRTELAV